MENSTEGLAEDLTAIVERIERLEAETKIKGYSKMLEKEVKKRTKELERRNKQLEEFKDFAVTREKEMIKLKRKIRELERR